MAMSRDEQDAFDRRMAGIMDPMLRPEGTAGGPVRSYSLDDIRRFLGFGNRPAMSPAEVADAAQMYERLPNPALPPTPPGGYDAPSPSIPYMPSTDPRGAAAPIPPPPRPAAPARPRLPVMAGMPSEADMQFQPARPDTFGGLSPADMAAMAAPAPVPSPVMDPIGPPPARPIAARGRPSPADLARALRESDERFARSTAQR
jgi:hypothetical protein